MYKNEFKGLSLSALGMGTMRFPVIDGNDKEIDENAAEQMIDYAMEQGINYYDTAWGYHGGNAELVTGKCLSKYPRDSYYLATKFPGYDLSNMGKAEEIFEKQLEKCRVDYFDFYMFHNVCEMNIDAYLDQSNGVASYLFAQKKAGRIRHLGFSAHGSREVIQRFLEAYGEHMEFCQLQLNYIDWTFQDVKAKAELLKEYDIPIWVMEPLRGGRLANLADKDMEKLKILRPQESVSAWAFRFIQSIPEVKVVLSGMSDFGQLRENIKTFEKREGLNKEEMETLLKIAEDMVGKIALPCTACHYCTSHCPQGLDIPNLLELYNEHSFTGGGFLAPMALSALPEDKQPSACIGCKQCEAVCPQQIKISEAMAEFTAKLG